MKKFLRKWLEIPEIPDTSEFVEGDDVKQLISDALVEAFTEITESAFFQVGHG